MALDADTLKRLSTMDQASAIALLSGMSDLQSIAVTATPNGEGGMNYGDLRPIYTNGGEGTETNGPTGFQKILTPDLEGAADIKGRARFVGNYDASGKLTGIERQDMGLSGGFLADHLETIGPIAVALAAAAGGLPPGTLSMNSAAPAASGAAGTGAGASAGAGAGGAAAGADAAAQAYAAEVAGTSATAVGSATAATTGAGAAAAPSLLDRVLASPVAGQVAGALIGSAVLSSQMPQAAQPSVEAPPPAPAPTLAASQPALDPIYSALGNRNDTPVSTFLTGPQGIDPTRIKLGRNILLGA